jgi:hypothetical protein
MGLPQGRPTLNRYRLTPERIRAGLPQWLLQAVGSFEPLPFEAGRGAVNWLRDHLEDPCDPWLVVLTCAGDGTLLGFFVLAVKQFAFPPDGEQLSAMEVAWIARAADTEKGFGGDLLTYATSIALKEGATAFFALPNDPETAAKVWRGRFSFEPLPVPDPSAEEAVQMFLGLEEPEEDGPLAE